VEIVLMPATLTDCSFACPGNQYEYCGGGEPTGVVSS
jgi:hypothetical protein